MSNNRDNGKNGPSGSLKRFLGRACVRALRRLRTEEAYHMAVVSMDWWEKEMLKNLETLDELELEKLMGLESPNHDEKYQETEDRIVYLFGKKEFEFQLMDRIEKDAQKYL